jgi:two-component system response regulator BaeR
MSQNRTVLVVEDEEKLAALLCDYLRAHGFEPKAVADGQQALAMFHAEPTAVVLLDLNLPGMDGLELCRALRRDSAVPILMLTARAEEFDRVLGLEMGADDYLCKPYSPREVVARVRALLRRAEGRLPGGGQTLINLGGGFKLDETGLRAWWRDLALPLTPLEFRLLRALLQQPGRVFSRSQLLDNIHADFRDVSDRAVDSHIKNLRRKLQNAVPGHDCVVAVYGAGYRFDLPPA